MTPKLNVQRIPTMKVHVVKNTAPTSLVFHLYTALFVGLKLGGCISWSWWAVFIPIYVAFVMAVIRAFLEALADEKAKVGQ